MKSEKQITDQLHRLMLAKSEHDMRPPGLFASRRKKIKHAHFSALFTNDIKTLQWVLDINEERQSVSLDGVTLPTLIATGFGD